MYSQNSSRDYTQINERHTNKGHYLKLTIFISIISIVISSAMASNSDFSKILVLVCCIFSIVISLSSVFISALFHSEIWTIVLGTVMSLNASVNCFIFELLFLEKTFGISSNIIPLIVIPISFVMIVYFTVIKKKIGNLSKPVKFNFSSIVCIGIFASAVSGLIYEMFVKNAGKTEKDIMVLVGFVVLTSIFSCGLLGITRIHHLLKK